MGTSQLRKAEAFFNSPVKIAQSGGGIVPKGGRVVGQPVVMQSGSLSSMGVALA